jgi:hypothetical protein
MISVNRLYHFTAAKYGFDDLRNRRLKIAQLDELNDPFELKSVNLCDPVHAQAFDGTDKFEGFKSEMARRCGVLCFSEDQADVLQWAHYADRHKGVCLGFDVSGSEGKFGRVDYVNERFPFPKVPDEAFAWKLLSTKSQAWKYEKEWRVFLKLSQGIWDQNAGRLLYFANFGSDLILRELILGAENRNPDSEVYDAVQGFAEPVRVGRMRLFCDTFGLHDCSLR